MNCRGRGVQGNGEGRDGPRTKIMLQARVRTWNEYQPVFNNYPPHHWNHIPSVQGQYPFCWPTVITTVSHYIFLILHPNKSLLKFLRPLKLNSYTHLNLLEKFSKGTHSLKRVHKPSGTISFILFMNHIAIIFLAHCHLVGINKKH